MKDNSRLVVEYLNSRMREGNLKPASQTNAIDRLSRLSTYHKNKSFRQLIIEDIFEYLDSLRRPEGKAPLHRLIGTYNLSVVTIIPFFKWLYEPDTHSHKSCHIIFDESKMS